MNQKWVNLIGLILNILGSIVLCYGLVISKKNAIELGVSRFSADKDDENLKLPQVKDRLKQSRKAIIGMLLLILGFILQVIANWPKN